MKFGIDVSHWQGVINWDLAVERGVEFAYLKATDFNRFSGTGFEDSRLRENAKNLDRLKLPYGLYHWLQPNVDGLRQADFFLRVYHSLGSTLPPAVDFEDSSFRDKNRYLYYLQQWLERVAEQTNTRPVIYTRKSFLRQFDSKRIGFLGSYLLWEAFYPVPQARYKAFPLIHPKPYYPFTSWYMWQYSEKGNGLYYGVSSRQVDLNWMNDTTPTSVLKVMVTATAGLRVRKEPSTNSDILKTLPYKTQILVDLSQSTSDWYKLYQEDGYIYKLYTTIVPDSV